MSSLARQAMPGTALEMSKDPPLPASGNLPGRHEVSFGNIDKYVSSINENIVEVKHAQ